ncbi:MAG TPA: hypothetical protein V6C90_07700 [Coleofasciculaceae cyanobacterium]
MEAKPKEDDTIYVIFYTRYLSIITVIVVKTKILRAIAIFNSC